MRRNVRNFRIEAEVDGRKTLIAFGPRGKDGGFYLTVYMRNKGEVMRNKGEVMRNKGEVMRNKGEVEAVLGLQGKVTGKNLELWIDSSEVGEEGQEANQGITIICRER